MLSTGVRQPAGPGAEEKKSMFGNAARYVQTLLQLVGLLCLFALVVPAGPTLAADEAEEVEVSRQQGLDLQAFLVWQRLNEARSNPRAVLERLGLPVEQVRNQLGEDAWLLDSGLPALAWNDQLQGAMAAHGRDMFDQLYYSHTSLDGRGPRERIAATGYQALIEDETLAALVFSSYIDVKLALDAMLDIMLRDELTGVAGVARNVFSPELTEVGISFFAESIEILEGQPYVYLLALDFATPLEPRSFLIGAVDPGASVMLQTYFTQFWQAVPLGPGADFQVAFPASGGELVVTDAQGNIVNQVSVYDNTPGANRFVDLRVAGVD
jgi:hypothetical protein